jgi:hypothetical protein
VEFEAIAHKTLRRHAFTVHHELLLGANREAKHGQATVLLPEFAEAPINTKPRLREATLCGLNSTISMRDEECGDDSQYNQQRFWHDISLFHYDVISI